MSSKATTFAGRSPGAWNSSSPTSASTSHGSSSRPSVPNYDHGEAPYRKATATLTRRVKQAISEWYVLNMLELTWGGLKAKAVKLRPGVVCQGAVCAMWRVGVSRKRSPV